MKYFRYVIVGLAGGLLFSGLAFFVMGRNFGFENVSPIAVAPGFLVGFAVTMGLAVLITRSRESLYARLEAEQCITADLRAEMARRNQVENALQESDERYRVITDAVSTGLLVHRNDSLLFANPAAVEMFGAGSEADLLGLNPIEMVRADDRALVYRSREQPKALQFPANDQRIRHIRLDGSEFWSSGHARNITFEGEPATLLVIRDVTERVIAEQELQTSRERFQGFAESSADWFWETDADLQITFVSESVERIMGIPPEWFIGMSRAELAADAVDAESWAEHVADLEARRPFRDYEYLRRGDDQVEPCWIRASATPIFGDEGQFLGYRGTASDITEYKQAEERLRVSEERLAQAEKLKSVGQLTGGIAHDFNNLLAVIQGNAELLSDELDPSNAPVQTILRATKRGSDLTQRLLAYSRRQPLRPEAINLPQHIMGLTDLLARTLGETIEVETGAPADIAAVMADPSQLENALLNLSINARDAMPEGGKLTIACSSISLEDEDSMPELELGKGEYVAIAVSDTGHGMPASVREQAFEPFFTTKDVGEGSGLGLSMVFGFARQSGGDVSIESEAGRGTTVNVYLPVATDTVRPATPVESGDVATGSGETILVIEDDADVRALTVRMLAALGYKTIDVADAAGARDVLASGAAPDLMLSDVILPGGTSGPQFADTVREQHPGIKIIFMSGYPDEAARQDGFPGSDSVLLNKPFQRRQLLKAVREALV